MNELAKFIDDFINNMGIKKTWIASQLGISQQLLYRKMIKKNFTINDANEILGTVGYKLEYNIVRIDEEEKEENNQS